MITPLPANAIDEALQDLPEWSYEDDQLTKTFLLKNFRDAMAFLLRIGFEAEALNHHPQLYNVYNKVQIHLTTHDCGNKVSHKDISLAKKIEQIPH